MDKMTIKGAKFLCNIGVSEKERSKKQEIIVDAELFFNFKKASSTDNIKNTINYSEVYASIKNVAVRREYKLIETLAEKIAEEVLSSYPAKKVVAKVKKPISYAEYAAVEITRKNG